MNNERIDINITDDSQWAGYSLSELKYKRALFLARKEIQKGKMLMQMQGFMQADVTPRGVGGSIFKNIFGHLTIVDYLLIGFKIARKSTKLWNKLRK
ncbi:MAG: hypothetical protein RR061_09990 [Muribaculaceae bacterium]